MWYILATTGHPGSYLAHEFLQKPCPSHLPPFVFYHSSTNSFASDTVASLLRTFGAEWVPLLFWSSGRLVPAYLQSLFPLLVVLAQVLSYQGGLSELFCIKKKNHTFTTIFLFTFFSWLPNTSQTSTPIVMLCGVYLSISVSPTRT